MGLSGSRLGRGIGYWQIYCHWYCPPSHFWRTAISITFSPPFVPTWSYWNFWRIHYHVAITHHLLQHPGCVLWHGTFCGHSLVCYWNMLLIGLGYELYLNFVRESDFSILSESQIREISGFSKIEHWPKTHNHQRAYTEEVLFNTSEV